MSCETVLVPLCSRTRMLVLVKSAFSYWMRLINPQMYKIVLIFITVEIGNGTDIK